MKTLYLVRHAKSSWDHPGVGDFQRPLMEAGKKRTRTVIRFIQDKEIRIDLIISSPATRAFETAKLIAKGIHYPIGSIKPEMTIYEGNTDDILSLIYGVPNDISGLMIVGHNPALTHLVNIFLKPGIDILPTTGVAAFSFLTDLWENIPESPSELEFLVYPKMLKK